MFRHRAPVSVAALAVSTALASTLAFAPGVHAAPPENTDSTPAGAYSKASRDTGTKPARQAKNARAGFVLVNDLRRMAPGATPLALRSPAANDLWIAARGRDGALMMIRKLGNRWTAHRTSVSLAADAAVTIDGLDAKEVWATAAGSLLRFDGRRWADIGARGVTYTTVADAPGRGAYAGTRKAISESSHESRVIWTDGRRTRDLGSVYPDMPGRATLARIRVSGSQVFAEWGGQKANGSALDVWGHVRGTWVERYVNQWEQPRWAEQHATSWLVTSRGSLLTLGRDMPRSNGQTSAIRGLCHQWTGTGKRVDCTTAGAVGAADVRSDGRVVIGGDDAAPTATTPLTAGTFRMRDRTGTETVIPGDPGDATLALTVEPRTHVAWALTRTGSTTTLQTYRG